MSITRKEFFREGFFSLGRTALDLAGTLKSETVTEPMAQQMSEPPEPRPDMVAEAFNERCLARNSGCSACSERCEPRAIVVVPGTGIVIDGTLCNGCGTCEYVCPVQPRAVALVPRVRKM
ncbi:MAG: 4Fe-4S binding protein [Geobacteraceae bacterium]|nr:4Fe-4S binding protein [Geobacteraceae bacterium]